MPRHLMEHPEDVSVVRLRSGDTPAFDWHQGPLASVTHTADETSVICPTSAVPRGARTEGPYRAVEVAGPLDFAAVGVFAEILAPLVDAGISVLGISTFDTDWILVPVDESPAAADVWRRAGFVVTPTTLTGSRA